MSSRKKLIVSLSVVACVIVAAVIAVVAVLAATQQTVTSNVTVSYTAADIDATVSAKYQVKGRDTAVDMTSTGTAEGSKTLEFNAEDDEAKTLSLTPTENIVFQKTEDEVTFTYTFVNTGSTTFYAKANVTLQSKEGTAVSFEDANLTISEGYNTVHMVAGDTTAEVVATFTISVTDLAKNVEDVQIAISWDMNTSQEALA